jgi:hypothetical protein
MAGGIIERRTDGSYQPRNPSDGQYAEKPRNNGIIDVHGSSGIEQAGENAPKPDPPRVLDQRDPAGAKAAQE